LADFGPEKFSKKLIGKTSVEEEALLRLDSLTKEENLMAVANILEVADHVDGNVEQIKAFAESTDGNVKQIKVLAENTDGNIEQIKALAESTNGRVQEIDQTVKAVEERTQSFLSSFTHVSTLFPIASHNRTRSATTFVNPRPSHRWPSTLTRSTGNMIQKELRTWLSPPDSSIDHNTARETQHGGTTTWFIQSTKFREWKNTGSLLWINGNRTLLSPILPHGVLIPFPMPQPAQAKVSFGTR
jgi:uncharacterized protein YoxC